MTKKRQSPKKAVRASGKTIEDVRRQLDEALEMMRVVLGGDITDGMSITIRARRDGADDLVVPIYWVHSATLQWDEDQRDVGIEMLFEGCSV